MALTSSRLPTSTSWRKEPADDQLLPGSGLEKACYYGAVGWLLLIAALPVFPIVTLKGLSYSILFPNLAVNIMKLIWNLPLVPFLWDHAPAPDAHGQITFFNLYYGTAFGLEIAGGFLARKGWHISELIARAKDQIAVDQMAGRSKAVEIEITQLVDQDKWWSRPAGVVALSVIGSVIAGVLAILIAQIIMLKLGLVH